MYSRVSHDDTAKSMTDIRWCSHVSVCVCLRVCVSVCECTLMVDA